jgi:integrase
LAELDTKAKGEAEQKVRAGTLRSLVLDYRASERFTDLKPRTRQDYKKVFNFIDPILDQPLSAFDTTTVIALKNRWKEVRGRCFVNYVITVLKLVFGHGMDEQLVASNPVSGVRRIRRNKNAVPLNRKWEATERTAVWAACPPQLRLPLAIGLTSGMREGDVLALKRGAIKDGRIKIRTAKRDVWIDIPVSLQIREAIASQPAHDAITLCVTSRGTPWTEDGFRASFFKFIKRLEQAGGVQPGLTFHGLRHTVASVLAENAASAEDIAAVLGHKSSAMAEHYAADADRSRRTRATISKLRVFDGRDESDI